MLVLTRRTDQKIVFPTVGITVNVLRIQGNVVKIGVDAPREMPVLRHELVNDDSSGSQPSQAFPTAGREERHAMLNRLNGATIALHLLRKQLDRGMHDDADGTLSRLLEELQTLEQAIARQKAPTTLRRALLVEDDRNECELLAGYLRMSGFEVATAQDGVDALDHLSSHERPDVVLLDMLMPRCNGARTVELIRRNPDFRDLKLFAISGTAPSDLGVATGPEGIDLWFSKPVNPERLVTEIGRALAPVAGVA